VSSQTSGGARAYARQIGDDIEHRVASTIAPVALVPDDVVEWHDAVARRAFDDRAAEVLTTASAPVVPRGSTVEIKSAREVTSNGADTRAGRWYFKRKQHGKLVRVGGWYLLVVYLDGFEREIVDILAIPASIIDELIGDRWHDNGRREATQLSWTRLLDGGER